MPGPTSPPRFFKTFIHLFAPVAIQNLFFNLIGIFDVLMVGQLGDVSVAAVGLAGQFFFLLNLTLFGITGGAAVFVAQYWGARDLPNLRRVLGLSLAVCVSVGIAFAAVALAVPGAVMGAYTQDAAVMALGSAYLRLIGGSYVFTAISFAFATTLRSSGNTRLPMLVSVSMLVVNTLLDYSLIFGRFGLPTLGARGSAVGTALCRGLECVILLGLVYGRRLPIAATPRQLFDLDWTFASRHLRLILLVFINEFLWALGVNVYNALMARLGTSAYAGYSIATTLQSLGLFYGTACATTCAILVGHSIGAGELAAAYEVARRILLISVAGSFGLGLVLVAVRQPLLGLYQVSPEAHADASAMLLVAGLMLWLRSLDPMLIVGILRNGGDTRHAAILDVGAIWLAGIPAMALAAFVFRLPVQGVYLAIMAENLLKNALALRRFFSRRWIRNLAAPV
jgi:putative MATE family efflux protein